LVLACLSIAQVSFAAEAPASDKVAQTFTYKPAPGAAAPKTVHVAGDFQRLVHHRRADDEVRRRHVKATVKLRPGQYLYKFVLDDGERWLNDPQPTRRSKRMTAMVA
jgi:hypothetical protein